MSDLQQKIVGHLESHLGEKCEFVTWKHQENGGGLSCFLQETKHFFKASVLFSDIRATLSEKMQKTLGARGHHFSACGVSLIFHPISPRIPTVHMNVRFFQTDKDVFWFGAVIDLTPYYPHVEDFVFFHQQLKKILDKIDVGLYAQGKKWCDDYFTLPHRNEMRGVGGVFFDHLKDNAEKNFELVRCVGDLFLPCYFSIYDRRAGESFTKDEQLFQSFRHGRYVEFNLLYDRGTKFGLESGGRVESIMSSLPPYPYFPSDFDYAAYPKAAEMKEYYQPREWV